MHVEHLVAQRTALALQRVDLRLQCPVGGLQDVDLPLEQRLRVALGRLEQRLLISQLLLVVRVRGLQVARVLLLDAANLLSGVVQDLLHACAGRYRARCGAVTAPLPTR